ncbi:NXPE family member 3-like [Haliotis rufescens]|uniref:NXPE family member 3-like n=1 Tax=Haliotis rufescens TaxID=6454 RepID=UPI001EB09C8E|nr:NXPE family member 3-like [Haliotis rufescens]
MPETVRNTRASSTMEEVVQASEKSNQRVNDIFFKIAHRLRKSECQCENKPSAPRSIVASFLYLPDREAVFQARKLLKGTGISIQTDLPGLMKKQRAILSRQANIGNNIRERENLWTRVRVLGTEVILETKDPHSPFSAWKTYELNLALSTFSKTHVSWHDEADGLPYMSQMTESKLLKEPLTYDLNRLPSEVQSRVVHTSSKTVYNLGETVKVKILLYDAFKRPLHRGGDILTVSMDGQNGASSAGRIIDHQNGSYTGILRAMWTGSCSIVANILCTRESFAMTYQLINGFRTSMNLTCVFELEALRETTLAYPSPAPFPGQRLCNLTAENYGMPWYCVKPTTPGLLCSDWTKVSTISYETFPSFRDKVLDQVFLLRDFLHSWSASSPIGFFHKQQWHHVLCTYPTGDTALRHCLRNRRLVMFGDSTVRQMFSYIHMRLNMTFVTLDWVGKKWHRYTEAERKDSNFSMSWSPHGLPLYFFESGRGVARPVHITIDEVPAGSRDILLIHLYAHFQYHHPSVLRNNLRHVAQSVKRLLQRAPDVVVAIKGPHSFGPKNRFIGGYWGPTYADIVKEEFRSLYDKVAYLDYWDMSVALHLEDVHPDADGVEQITKLFLGYACTDL